MERASHLSFEQRATDNRSYGILRDKWNKNKHDGTNDKIKEEAGTLG